VVRRNAAALTRTVTALRDAGLVEHADDALIALARSTADSLDRAEPGTAAAASCARAHAAVLDRLRGLCAHDRDDDLADLLGDVSATLGDPAQP
jgi:hypothetical protein